MSLSSGPAGKLAAGLLLAGNLAFADTLYVDNVKGSDRNTGTRDAPLSSIERACAVVKKSGRIHVIPTGKPYSLPYGGAGTPRGLRLSTGGTAEKPLIVEGNGTTISGFAVVPPGEWKPEAEKFRALHFWPMSNHYRHSPENYWLDANRIWFVDGQAAPNCHSREELEKTPGGFWWNKKEKQVLFHPPADRKFEELRIELPANFGFYLQADHIIVRNFIMVGSWNDGFDTAGNARNGLYQNCVAIGNCGQGFSAHDATNVTYEDCVTFRCASSAICNIGTSRAVYRRCVIAECTYEAVIHLYDDADTLFEQCLIADPHPNELIWLLARSSAAFVDSILIGNPDANLARTMFGSLAFINCSLLNARSVTDLSDANLTTGMTMERCLLASLTRYAVKLPAKYHRLRLLFRENQYAPGINFIQNGQPLPPAQLDRKALVARPVLTGIRRSEASYGDRRRSRRRGAILPESVWKNYEKWRHAEATPAGVIFQTGEKK